MNQALPLWTSEELKSNLTLTLAEAVDLASQFIPGLGSFTLSFARGKAWLRQHGLYLSHDEQLAALYSRIYGDAVTGAVFPSLRTVYVRKRSISQMTHTLWHEIAHSVLHINWQNIRPAEQWLTAVSRVASGGGLGETSDAHREQSDIEERQADAIAVIACSPYADSLNVVELQQRFNFRPDQAALRAELAQMNWRQFA